VATDWTQEHRLKRLMLFRVVMITTLLLIAIGVETVSETLLPVNPLYFLIAGTYGLTLVYALALRFLSFRDVQVYVQIIFDLLVITGLIYLTGGPGNRAGFMLLYPISVLSGSILLYRRKSLVLAGVATLFYAAMLKDAPARELIAIICNELSGRGRINFGADILIRHFSYSFPIRGNLRQIELTQLADRIALDLVRFPIKDGPALFQWVKQRQIDNSF